MKFQCVYTKDGSTLFGKVRTFDNIELCVQNERKNMRGKIGVNVCYFRHENFVETTPQNADGAIISGHNNVFVYQIIITELK